MLIASLFLGACSSDKVDSTPDSGVLSVQNSDTGVDVVLASDAGVVESDAGVIPEICQSLKSIPQTFKNPSNNYDFGSVAGDFTVNELYGRTWNFRENWTGCESFVFVNYIPVQGNSDDAFWNSRSDVLVKNTSDNTHFFFISWENSAAARKERVESIYAYIASEIEFSISDSEERERQLSRFHFVLDAPADIQGSVSGFISDYMQYRQLPESVVDLGGRGNAAPPLPLVFGIDRDQKWDSGGSMSEYVGGPQSFRMAGYLGDFYNHKARVRDQVARETDIQTYELLNERVTQRVFVKTATLPDAAEMKDINTLEFDVTVNCPHRNVFACSEWDRIARIEVCTSTTVEPCSKRRELVRWITPYWRRGERRWIMDASSLLGYIKEGGLQYFRLEMGPSWERATSRDARIALRLSKSSDSLKAVGAVRAFTGGGFGDKYNDREPFVFTLPSQASKVSLVSILSGHGQDSNTNCAEWCDHRHQFEINGTSLEEIRHEGNRIGSADGCGWAAAEGASPGQWGNWAPERAYWCPGLPVEHRVRDLTNYVTLGEENTLTYRANYGGGPPAGGSISLSTYVVWYE